MVLSYRLLAFVFVVSLFAPLPAAWGQTGASLAVTATVDEPAPFEGATIVYTVTLTNLGPDNARSIQVDELLPSGVTSVSNAITDDFNQGMIGPGNCTVSVEDVSWGEVKARYR